MAEGLADGAHLVTMTTPAENAFVAALVAARPDAWNGGWGPWIGAYQWAGGAEPAGGWRWITGEAWTHANWRPGEPNDDKGGETFGHLFQWCGQANVCDPPTANTWNDSKNRAVRDVVGFIAETAEPPN